MKTLIELFVSEPYDDLLASFVFKPERVVFVCTDRSPDKLSRRGMTGFLKSLRPDIEVEFVHAGCRTVGALYKRLADICSRYPDCAVELSGGSSAALIAAESYCARNRINAFYFDRAKGRFVSIRGMRRTISRTPLPVVDIPSLFGMGGAKVTGSCHSVKQLQGNIDCVREVLKVYCKNLDEWNACSEYLQYCCKHFYDSATQLFSAPATIRNNNTMLFANRRIISQLQSAGALSELAADGDTITFRFRNSFLREVVTTVGMCLELMVYIGALDCGGFDAAEMSVVFDWDGVVHANGQDTVNELDVVMTRGFMPVFVSCKSAKPDTRDLYEIWYLAKRFGGRHAKAVLATAVPFSADAWASYIRARDMGIIVIERSDVEAYGEKDWLKKRLLAPKWRDDRPRR